MPQTAATSWVVTTTWPGVATNTWARSLGGKDNMPRNEVMGRNAYMGRNGETARNEFMGRCDYDGRNDYMARRELMGRNDYVGSTPCMARNEFMGRRDYLGRKDDMARTDAWVANSKWPEASSSIARRDVMGRHTGRNAYMARSEVIGRHDHLCRNEYMARSQFMDRSEYMGRKGDMAQANPWVATTLARSVAKATWVAATTWFERNHCSPRLRWSQRLRGPKQFHRFPRSHGMWRPHGLRQRGLRRPPGLRRLHESRGLRRPHRRRRPHGPHRSHPQPRPRRARPSPHGPISIGQPKQLFSRYDCREAADRIGARSRSLDRRPGRPRPAPLMAPRAPVLAPSHANMNFIACCGVVSGRPTGAPLRPTSCVASALMQVPRSQPPTAPSCDVEACAAQGDRVAGARPGRTPMIMDKDGKFVPSTYCHPQQRRPLRPRSRARAPWVMRRRCIACRSEHAPVL